MRATSLWASFRFAFAGLFYIVRTQRNARIHLLIAALAVAAGLWLGLDRMSWAVLILTMGFVFSIEVLNTVIETLVDLTSPEIHPLAKIAKDAAAAAVLVAALIAVIVGLIVLGPPLVQVLFSPAQGTSGGLR